MAVKGAKQPGNTANGIKIPRARPEKQMKTDEKNESAFQRRYEIGNKEKSTILEYLSHDKSRQYLRKKSLENITYDNEYDDFDPMDWHKTF